MLGEPVISKNQKAGRIKQSDIEVQIHAITSGKNYGQVGNFGDNAVIPPLAVSRSATVTNEPQNETTNQKTRATRATLRRTCDRANT